jgi:3-oxoacyl-[acyl-carrier protein] reductase
MSSVQGKLAGRTAIVTGSGRGIGRAIAEKFASEGARVVINDLDAEPAAEVVDAITKSGGEAVACNGSVCDSDFGERAVAMALDRFGGLDVIVNNAGYTWDSVIQKMGDDQWDAILDVHLKAPFRLLRAAQPHLSAARKADLETGRQVTRKVINISSIAGLYGNAGQANYSSAKMGVVGMTRALAKEWGRYNVAVNCVAYGYIQTRLTETFTDTPNLIEIEGGRQVKVGVQGGLKTMVEQMTPLGRAGTIEDAAGAVYLFAIPESDYISGQVVVCGGGLLV